VLDSGGGGEVWITPRYWRINVPGLRSFVAKSPLWPHAGWDGVVIGVIFTSGQSPKGVVAGISGDSFGRVCRAVL